MRPEWKATRERIKQIFKAHGQKAVIFWSCWEEEEPQSVFTTV